MERVRTGQTRSRIFEITLRRTELDRLVLNGATNARAWRECCHGHLAIVTTHGYELIVWCLSLTRDFEETAQTEHVCFFCCCCCCWWCEKVLVVICVGLLTARFRCERSEKALFKCWCCVCRCMFISKSKHKRKSVVVFRLLSPVCVWGGVLRGVFCVV